MNLSIGDHVFITFGGGVTALGEVKEVHTRYQNAVSPLIIVEVPEGYGLKRWAAYEPCLRRASPMEVLQWQLKYPPAT